MTLEGSTSGESACGSRAKRVMAFAYWCSRMLLQVFLGNHCLAEELLRDGICVDPHGEPANIPLH